MMHGTDQIRILYTLRKHGEMTFDEFMYECGEDLGFTLNTHVLKFYGALARLINEGFVRLSDSKLSSRIRNINNPSHFSTVPGKPLYDLMCKKTFDDIHKVQIRLTDKLFEMQEILGFSITDAYENILAEQNYLNNRYFRKVLTKIF